MYRSGQSGLILKQVKSSQGMWFSSQSSRFRKPETHGSLGSQVFPFSLSLALSTGELQSLLSVLFSLTGSRNSIENDSEEPNHEMWVKLMTSENEKSHGSLFLRIGAIAFGVGTLIYTGLEFLTFFEIPKDCSRWSSLLGVNPVLYMIFVFMQVDTYRRGAMPNAF